MNVQQGSQMNRTLIAALLTLATAGASALEWPGQNPAAGQQAQEYCKGLVVGGLGSKQVSGRYRTDLWLAWSYIIRSGALNQTAATNELQVGLEKFQNAPDSAAAQAIVQQADGDCGLGRSGLQITGW